MSKAPVIAGWLLFVFLTGCGNPDSTTATSGARDSGSRPETERLNLSLAGASPSGLWSLIAAGIDAAAKRQVGQATITYQTSGGGFANAALLSNQRVDLALVHDAELKIALAGDAPFSKPIGNLKAIGYMYTWAPIQFFLEKSIADEHGVRSLDGIATARLPLNIAVNRAGNIAGLVALDMLAESGISEGRLEEWGGSVVRAGSSEQANLLIDGRVDMLGNSLLVRHSSLREVENTIDVLPLTIPEPVVEKINDKYGIRRYVIPAGTYENQPERVVTSALGAMLVVNENMSTDKAYALAKALTEHIDALRAVHASMRPLTPEILASQELLPFHPGALKAYREAGLVK